jgi:hypothetical protein
MGSTSGGTTLVPKWEKSQLCILRDRWSAAVCDFYNVGAMMKAGIQASMFLKLFTQRFFSRPSKFNLTNLFSSLNSPATLNRKSSLTYNVWQSVRNDLGQEQVQV